MNTYQHQHAFINIRQHHEQQDVQNETLKILQQSQSNISTYCQFSETQQIQDQIIQRLDNGRPLYQPQKNRGKMNIELSSKFVQIHKTSNLLILKKWFNILKAILKQKLNMFQDDQQNSIKQFYFGFGDLIQNIRKILGFTKTASLNSKQFQQIKNCQRIRNFLLQAIDSCQIINAINFSKFTRKEKLQLISTIDLMRDFIINPNMEI